VKNEHIDETIDRVAAELTAVPADPGFSARLRDQLAHRQHHSARWALASATAAVLVAAVVVLRFYSAPPEDAASGIVIASRGIGAGPVELPLGGLVGSVRAGLVSAAPEAGTLPMAPSDSEGEALASEPGALTVSPLVVEPVNLPAVLDIAPLEVPHLEIVEIGAGHGAKEPR
jgi:hypothetical protein